ncbi:GFA family protein [Gilvimarinus sp. F26214L]|uniref:GFA family protein n=1 Tax=Gilvimarinus sp. DZF01 TaxID=3461371 RepID=UPI0040462A3F
MNTTYAGSCHCGAIKFEADLDLSQGTGKCNCSICTKTRYWGALAKPEQFRLIQGQDALGDYQFGTRSGHHLFCRHCGVRPFLHGYLEVIGGEYYSVNIACIDNLEPEEFAKLPVNYADGRDDNWINPPAVTSYL